MNIQIPKLTAMASIPVFVFLFTFAYFDIQQRLEINELNEMSSNGKTRLELMQVLEPQKYADKMLYLESLYASESTVFFFGFLPAFGVFFFTARYELNKYPKEGTTKPGIFSKLDKIFNGQKENQEPENK